MNEHPISNGHRILTLLVVLVLSTATLAEPPGGEKRFTVTLQPAAALDAASAAKRLASTYGGTLEDGESGGESFILQISPSRARLMAADPHVAAVEPTAQAAVPPEIVTWSSGVTFSYDGSGNIRQIGQDKFGYDAVGRLVHAKVNEVVRDYQYDAFGNRESCSQAAGTEDCQAGYTVDPATNRIAEIQYDPAGSGNVIGFRGHTYAYDALNMMTSDTFVGTREFIYTPDDERIGTYSSVSRSWQWTIRDTSGKILREFVSDGGSIGAATWTWSKDYVWRDGVLLASRQTNGTTTNTFHYHLDHLGSPRRITDGNDRIVGFHDYFAFGVEAGGHDEQPQSRLQYTGHERDAQGDDFASLDYMLARYYSPMLGRFLSADPNPFWELQHGSDEDRAKFGDYLRHPQRWNRYAYVSNNPINKIDPDGREENFYMEKLFREQQMVGEGKMTEEQYWDRRKGEGYGTLAGVAIVAGGWAVIKAGALGYTAFQAWRAASAAAATIKVIEQASRGDARIFQSAMSFARGSANTFVNNLTALSRAVEQVVGPHGRITQIGSINGQAVWGSARTGFGITQIDGVTKIVQMLGDGKYQIIGNFR